MREWVPQPGHLAVNQTKSHLLVANHVEDGVSDLAIFDAHRSARTPLAAFTPLGAATVPPQHASITPLVTPLGDVTPLVASVFPTPMKLFSTPLGQERLSFIDLFGETNRIFLTRRDHRVFAYRYDD